MIAQNYDKLNFLISFGLQKQIKEEAVKNALKKLKTEPLRILDLCTGTGDIAINFKKYSPNAQIIAVDFSKEMLAIAKTKSQNIQFIEKDVLQLGKEFPFEENSFDICFISFGLRNLPNIDEFLPYIKRYLTSGGVLSILDLGSPNILLQWYFRFHYRVVIPLFAKLFSNEPKAYSYLTESAKTYPAQNEILKKLAKFNYTELENINYYFGIIAQQLAKSTD